MPIDPGPDPLPPPMQALPRCYIYSVNCDLVDLTPPPRCTLHLAFDQTKVPVRSLSRLNLTRSQVINLAF